MKQTTNKRKFVKQKLMGFAMLIISAIIIIVAANGNSADTQDATLILITIPLGLYMLLTKNIIIM